MRPSTLLNEHLRMQAHAIKKKELSRANTQRRSSSRCHKLELAPPLGVSGGIRHIRIKTAFSHPINFNYIPDPMGRSPCSWCSSPFFGLFGHGEVEVEVIPFPFVNGHGYEEMPGGHAEGHKERSQMCVSCTFERVRIMGCEKHELRTMEVDPRLKDPGELERSVRALLENDKVGGELVENTKWCSICPSPAYFRCCSRPAEAWPRETNGCGLLLCYDCNDLLEKMAKDSNSAAKTLDRAVKHAAGDRFKYSLGARADASFLTSMGELKVRVQNGMGVGAAPGEMDETAISEDEAGDEEVLSILARVGKGKEKWNERQKVVAGMLKPGHRASSQGAASVSAWQTQKHPLYGEIKLGERERNKTCETGQVGFSELSGLSICGAIPSLNATTKAKRNGKGKIQAVIMNDDDEGD